MMSVKLAVRLPKSSAFEAQAEDIDLEWDFGNLRWQDNLRQNRSE